MSTYGGMYNQLKLMSIPIKSTHGNFDNKKNIFSFILW